MDAKRYYWFKLGLDFFASFGVKMLRKKLGGESALLYQLMLLQAINNDGRIILTGAVDMEEELSIMFDEPTELVAQTVSVLTSCKMIEVGEDAITFLNISELVGSETKDAERKRDERKRTALDNSRTSLDNVQEVSDNVQKCPDKNGQCPNDPGQCPTEIEIDNRDRVRVDTEIEKRETREDREKNTPPKPPSGGSAVSSPKHPKQIPKETVDRFERFWQHYPRKQARPVALQSFAKINPDDELTNRMIRAVEEQRLSDQWTRDSGQYIPYPATWLNQRRWEDTQDAIPIPKKENPFLTYARQLEAEERGETYDESRDSEDNDSYIPVLSALPF